MRYQSSPEVACTSSYHHLAVGAAAFWNGGCIVDASHCDFVTLLGLDFKPLRAPESKSTLKTGSRNDLTGFLAEFYLPDLWLAAVGGDCVWRCVEGCLARHTAMVAVSDQTIISKRSQAVQTSS